MSVSTHVIAWMGASSGPPPSGTWILETSFWADSGEWLDSSSWID